MRITACLLLLAALLPASGPTLAENATLPFDDASVPWREDKASRDAGIQAAERFLAGFDSERLAAIGGLLESFRNAAPTPEGRPGLQRFGATGASFVRQVAGRERLSAGDAFAPFAGRWYGVWDGTNVDHVWGAAVTATPAATPHGCATKLIALQDAWIGDGYGWNYLVRPAGTTGEVILGHVYHVERDDPTTVAFEMPHVGYLDGPGRLIWVTESFAFFEEILPASTGVSERYAITGLSYRWEGDTPVRTQSAVQAIYTRDPNDRPEWIRFAPVEEPPE